MRLDGKLLAVTLAVFVLVAGVAIAEEPAKEAASPAEKQSEEMAAEPAKAKQSEEVAEAESAQAEKSEEMAEAKDAESDKAEPSEEMSKARKAQPAEAKTAEAKGKAKAAKPAPEAKAAGAEKKSAQAKAQDGTAVSQIAICETVQERAPVGESDSFSSGIGKLTCFTRVQASETPTQIFHRWYVGEQLVDEIAINVKGRHWRCWSTKTIDPSWTGACRVEILTEEGDVISTKPFELGG